MTDADGCVHFEDDPISASTCSICHPRTKHASSEPAFKADETRRARAKIDDDGLFAARLVDCEAAAGRALSTNELIQAMNDAGWNASRDRVERLRR